MAKKEVPIKRQGEKPTESAVGEMVHKAVDAVTNVFHHHDENESQDEDNVKPKPVENKHAHHSHEKSKDIKQHSKFDKFKKEL